MLMKMKVLHDKQVLDICRWRTSTTTSINQRSQSKRIFTRLCLPRIIQAEISNSINCDISCSIQGNYFTAYDKCNYKIPYHNILLKALLHHYHSTQLRRSLDTCIRLHCGLNGQTTLQVLMAIKTSFLEVKGCMFSTRFALRLSVKSGMNVETSTHRAILLSCPSEGDSIPVAIARPWKVPFYLQCRGICRIV